jgi:hypothetical protein
VSLATDLKVRIETNKAAYESAQGQGSDAYFLPKAYHPMADGKYLSALAALHVGTLISDKHLQERLSAVCDRLAGSALPMGQEGKAWGLGFVWNNLSADEPYLNALADIFGVPAIEEDAAAMLANLTVAAVWPIS